MVAELGSQYVPYFPLVFPLVLVVMYLIDKRAEDPVIISKVTLGEDNRGLLRRLSRAQEKEGTTIGVNLDPKSQTSVTFAFRNPTYASRFKDDNKATLT